jgi:hypothetical protein
MYSTVQSRKAAGKLSKIVGNLKKRLHQPMNFGDMQMLGRAMVCDAGAATGTPTPPSVTQN